MSDDGSLGYWSHENIHSSYHHCNNDGIYEDESLAVSVGDERCGHRSLDNRYFSSINRIFYHSTDNGRGRSRY